VPGGSHGAKDLSSCFGSADVPESAREPAGHYGAASFQESPKKVGRLHNHAQSCPERIRVIGELAGSASNERCRQIEDSEPILNLAIFDRRKFEANVKYGRAKKELGRFISALGRSDQQLLGNRPIAYMKVEGLFWAQAPVIVETIGEVLGGECPEGRIPTGAFALGLIGAMGGVPALHDLADKPRLEEALTVSPRELACPYRNEPLILHLLEGGQRVG
jgi:hypothetical protein